MTVASRESWLTKVLGEEAGEKVQQFLGIQREELKQAASLLDSAGFERKSLTQKAEGEEEQPPTQPPAEQPPAPPAPEDESDPVLQVAGKLAEDISTAVEGDYSKLTEESLKAMLADAMRAQMPGEEAPPAEEPAAPVEEPAMAEDSKSLSEATKAFTETFAQMVKDQGDMAREQVQFTADLKVVKELLPTVQQLVEDVKQMRAEMNLKPRAASEAAETEVPSGTPQAESVRAEMDKGLQGGKKVFLGVEVENIPS